MGDSDRLTQERETVRTADPGRRLLDYVSAFISKVGFPVAVATFLLLTLYKGQQETNAQLGRIIVQNERIILLLEMKK